MKLLLKILNIFKPKFTLNTVILLLFWTLLNVYSFRSLAYGLPISWIFITVLVQYIAYQILMFLSDLLLDYLAKKKPVTVTVPWITLAPRKRKKFKEEDNMDH